MEEVQNYQAKTWWCNKNNEWIAKKLEGKLDVSHTDFTLSLTKKYSPWFLLFSFHGDFSQVSLSTN